MGKREVDALTLEDPARELAQPGGGAPDMVVLLHIRAELVQGQRVPDDRARTWFGGAVGRAWLDQVDAEVGLAALLTNVPAGGTAAGGAAAADVRLIQILSRLAVEQGGALLAGDAPGADEAGEERLKRAGVTFVPAGVGDLVGLDVHQPEGFLDLGAVVRSNLGGRPSLTPGAFRDVTLEVVSSGQVPYGRAVHALEPDEHVGAQVGPGEVTDVEPAIGRRRRGEREDRPVAESPAISPGRGPRGAIGVAPVERGEDQIGRAGVVEVVRLERLELDEHAGRHRPALAVHDEVAVTADDHERLSLVVLMRIRMKAWRNLPPRRAHTHRLDRSHIDHAQVDTERAMQGVRVIRTDDHL